MLAANELDQRSLWPFGISGDLPILLVRVVGGEDLQVARQALLAQEYWRMKGLAADVVLLNEKPVGYLDETQAELTALLNSSPTAISDRAGRAFLLRLEQLSQIERTFLQAVASAVIGGDRGSLASQLDRPLPISPVAPRTEGTERRDTAAAIARPSP